jgi:hypothetical protein
MVLFGKKPSDVSVPVEISLSHGWAGVSSEWLTKAGFASLSQVHMQPGLGHGRNISTMETGKCALLPLKSEKSFKISAQSAPLPGYCRSGNKCLF